MKSLWNLDVVEAANVSTANSYSIDRIIVSRRALWAKMPLLQIRENNLACTQHRKDANDPFFRILCRWGTCQCQNTQWQLNGHLWELYMHRGGNKWGGVCERGLQRPWHQVWVLQAVWALSKNYFYPDHYTQAMTDSNNFLIWEWHYWEIFEIKV